MKNIDYVVINLYFSSNKVNIKSFIDILILYIFMKLVKEFLRNCIMYDRDNC